MLTERSGPEFLAPRFVDWAPPNGDVERVLVCAHCNSLRAVAMALDRLTPQTIPAMKIATGAPLVHRLKANSTIEAKEILIA